MSKTTIAKKVASLFGANLDDAVTKTGAKSKGKMTRADGSTYSLMGDDLLRIQDNISQYKGAGKTLAVLSPLALVAFADKKSEPLKTKKEASDFEKAFSKAHNAGDKTFTFKGKEFNTEVRKGKAEGSIISEEDEAADRANRKAKHTEYRSGPRLGELIRQGKSEAEAEQQVEAEADEQFGDAYSFMSPQEKAERAQQSQAEETRRRDDEANVNFYRQGRAKGSLMMPAEGMPVDTYDNIPPEEMDEAMASQLPDDEMEDSYTSYVMDESLDDEEQEYLAGVLQSDPRLSDILDKVITVASEFSGAGEVDGPGTGVSDSIPARLSDGEFVITKKATDQIGADNLQLMMDDAERAYDGGYQMKAIGGYMQEDPEQQDSPLSKTDEEIKKLMMGANKMPSLR